MIVPLQSRNSFMLTSYIIIIEICKFSQRLFGTALINFGFSETNLRKVQKSLMRGPTNELIVIPRQLFETFDEVAQLIEKQKDLIKSSTALMTAASVCFI